MATVGYFCSNILIRDQMEFFLMITYLFLLTVSLSSAESEVYCYDSASCGPSSSLWPGVCQTGTLQSPISLPATDWTNILSTTVQRLTFNKEYASPEFYVNNNGHTIQISFSPNLNSSARMSGYGFSVPYVFSSVHFHWGDNPSTGSEHNVGGKTHLMEMHFVHYSSNYASLSEAVSSGDPTALAVIGVFIRPIQHEIFLISKARTAFNLIAKSLPLEITSVPIKVPQRLDLSPFLPSVGDGLYRYDGSLTSPTCNEQVIWTVRARPVQVGLWGYERFRATKDVRGLRLVNNFRPIQPRNGRRIEYFWKI